MKGQCGKEYELVFDTSGKAIGKKDAEGNFFPYKARGRPVVKGVVKNQSELQVKSISSEQMLNHEN